MPTDTVSIAQFIKDNRITMTAEWADRNPNMPNSEREMDNWKCVLRSGKKRMTVYFSMGMGHGGKQPAAEDVLDAVASDSAGLEDNFEDWCSNYGYDSDSRTAERIYKNCEHAAKRLRNFLGSEAFETLLYDTERL